MSIRLVQLVERIEIEKRMICECQDETVKAVLTKQLKNDYRIYRELRREGHYRK